ncbi:MAG TPA: class I SAM-dependent methyltransferase [Patescibacteria group bacterium]|nr:class I SAM-dependent methyltransferase [Patescibacteria group bacterium]
MNNDEERARVVATYNAAADTFDDPALSFWDRFGRETVARVSPRPGQSVLDACCGSGSSALPAAELVGPRGRVLAVDLAEKLLELGRAKARRQGLDNIEFRCSDFEETAAAGNDFDAVMCVFGIFFVSDMQRAVRALWRAVKPGGRLAITTWGANLFEPASSAFWKTVRSERADLYKAFNPWDRIADGGALRRLLDESGVEDPVVVERQGVHEIREPEDWWTVLRGSGYRGTLDLLDAPSLDRVRRASVEFARTSRLRALRTDVVYSVATKPKGGTS